MKNWAERECRIAAKRENPNYNFDSNDFDYGCNCYKSALKAYNSLMEDDHSGFSFEITKEILIRLMNRLPLTPITDDDFIKEEQYNDSDFCKKFGMASSILCSRMSGLYREEYLDGTVKYRDVNRVRYVNIEDPSDTYFSSTDIVDDIFPITMPYIPQNNKYEVYVQDFLTDKKNGDFDTRGVFYIKKPDGEIVDVNIFEAEKNGKWTKISKDEYYERLNNRIDKLNETIADRLIWTLVENSGTKEEIQKKKEAYDKIDDAEKKNILSKLSELCMFFTKPENYKYNTFNIRHALVTKNEHVYKDIPELVDIANFILEIL